MYHLSAFLRLSSGSSQGITGALPASTASNSDVNLNSEIVSGTPTSYTGSQPHLSTTQSRSRLTLTTCTSSTSSSPTFQPVPNRCSHHKYCRSRSFRFNREEFDPHLTHLYASTDGCIPSSTLTRVGQWVIKQQNANQIVTATQSSEATDAESDPVGFVIPWRYKNRKTGMVSWKVFHLCCDDIVDADSETIIVSPDRDMSLRAALLHVNAEAPREHGAPLVEFLLNVVRATLGDYGLEGGPTSHEADSQLLSLMRRQGHNFVMLCDVPIGLCRHKALLFKLLCDVVGLNCALVTGYSTSGRHQWNIITLPAPVSTPAEPSGSSLPSSDTPRSGGLIGSTARPAIATMDYLIDPTSPFFTWTKRGSKRTKAYKVSAHTSFGHGGFTQKLKGIF
ncbi:hypothetical protein DFS34DRAFT_628002 [Phlyctochytrium arcticum]|nr:hypothetical protein DFS34DRAFT_628002 [Phlyctochytrium arcticum]